MAKCPNCGYKLKPWNIRAECPECKVNIPNFDWINRLEQDSLIAEAANLKMKQSFTKFKFAFIGSKLRIARIPVSVAPLLAFFLPLFTIDFNLPYFDKIKNFNLITLISQTKDFDFGALSNYINSPVLGGATVRLLLAIVFVLLSVLALVPVSLFFLLRNYKNLQSKGLFISNLTAGFMMISSAALFTSFTQLQQASTFNAFSGKVGFGLIFGIVSFFASSFINLAVSKSDTNIDKLNKNLAENAEQSTKK